MDNEVESTTTSSSSSLVFKRFFKHFKSKLMEAMNHANVLLFEYMASDTWDTQISFDEDGIHILVKPKSVVAKAILKTYSNGFMSFELDDNETLPEEDEIETAIIKSQEALKFYKYYTSTTGSSEIEPFKIFK